MDKTSDWSMQNRQTIAKEILFKLIINEPSYINNLNCHLQPCNFFLNVSKGKLKIVLIPGYLDS